MSASLSLQEDKNCFYSVKLQFSTLVFWPLIDCIIIDLVLSYIKGHFQSRVVHHLRLSSLECCLPLRVSFQRRLSIIEGFLPKKVVFKRRPPSMEGSLTIQVSYQIVNSQYHSFYDYCSCCCKVKPWVDLALVPQEFKKIQILEAWLQQDNQGSARPDLDHRDRD